VDLPRVPPHLLAAAALVAVLWALVQTARLALRGWGQRRRLASARERGAQGEVHAEALLRRLGFRVLGRQVPVSYGLGVDGARVSIDLRADYLVSEGGRRYVAEVKTGVFAPRLETAATRRQLLEYRIAFDVDGVLLVDVEAGRVRLVEFPLGGAGRGRGSGRGSDAGGAGALGTRIAWLLCGVAAGVAAGAAASVLAMGAFRAL
jgi:hypothetical protein